MPCLGLLRMDIDTMRARGGPARIRQEVECPTIGVEQLDYRALMERTGGGAGDASVERDDRWKTIVRSMLDGGTFDADAQQRIVAIAQDPNAFEAFVSDIQKPLCSADGSPIFSAQAGAILDACRKVTEVVAARAPDAMLSVMQTVGKSSSRLTPTVVEAILQLEDDLSHADGDDDRVQMIAAMDETTLGAVIANVVTQEHGSTDRLERLLRILDKQGERSHEILAEARTALSRRLEGQPKRLEDLWSSVVRLAGAAKQTEYTPSGYATQLERVGERAATMSETDLPEECEAWLETVAADEVRRLSVTLLIDLLRLDPTDDQAEQDHRRVGTGRRRPSDGGRPRLRSRGGSGADEYA